MIVLPLPTFVVPPNTVDVPRNPGWESFRREIIKGQPACEASGVAWELEVHHLLPVHLRPDLEMVRDNCMVLTRTLHFWLGHYGNWASYNPRARKEAATFLKRVLHRPKPKGL